MSSGRLSSVRLVFFRPLTDDKPQRGAAETEGIPDPVLDIALIGKVHELFVIDKEDKGGRADACLGAVIDPERLSLVGRRLLHDAGLRDDLVEHAGLDPQVLVVPDHIDHIVELHQPLPCLCGDKDQLRIG